MTSRNQLLLICVAVTLVAAGCKDKKSSNPLSPSVAGPIAGVTITTPTAVSPTAGTTIAVSKQPITLTVTNATTSGERALSYRFEVALDSAFSNKVVTREGVTPGTGKTSLTLPDSLAAEQTYYWRARAQDGANTGEYFSGVNFSVYTPVVLQAPDPVSPVGDTRITGRNPTLVVTNAARSGPVTSITYEFQISSTSTFSKIVGTFKQAEETSKTDRALGSNLSYNTRYYWRCRALETVKSVTGPWSDTATFYTVEETKVVETPPSTGTGGHVTKGALTVAKAKEVIYATGDEFPNLTRVYSTDSAALAAAEELLLRMIWHLKLYGFQAGRQKNPSGAISKDKLTIYIDGAWHSYDICTLGYAGKATTVHFLEVWPANYVASSGKAD